MEERAAVAAVKTELFLTQGILKKEGGWLWSEKKKKGVCVRKD